MNNENSQQADVASILADLRSQIEERRARLVVSDPNDPHALNLAELRESVEAVNDTWYISAHLPITWDLRVVGRLGAYTKRLVRLLLRWYINPIVEQHNRFNSAAARAIVEMYAYQERMAREWQQLDDRLSALEAASGNTEPPSENG